MSREELEEKYRLVPSEEFSAYRLFARTDDIVRDQTRLRAAAFDFYRHRDNRHPACVVVHPRQRDSRHASCSTRDDFAEAIEWGHRHSCEVVTLPSWRVQGQRAVALLRMFYKPLRADPGISEELSYGV